MGKIANFSKRHRTSSDFEHFQERKSQVIDSIYECNWKVIGIKGKCWAHDSSVQFITDLRDRT